MGDWYTKVKAEFILNFVEDNRWKYLVTGLGNTLKITLAAVLLGIVIGTLGRHRPLHMGPERRADGARRRKVAAAYRRYYL